MHIPVFRLRGYASKHKSPRWLMPNRDQFGASLGKKGVCMICLRTETHGWRHGCPGPSLWRQCQVVTLGSQKYDGLPDHFRFCHLRLNHKDSKAHGIARSSQSGVHTSKQARSPVCTNLLWCGVFRCEIKCVSIVCMSGRKNRTTWHEQQVLHQWRIERKEKL